MQIKLKRKRLGAFLILLALIVIVAGVGAYRNQGLVSSASIDKKDNKIRELLALPYLAFVEDDPNPEKKGVTLYNKEKAYEGANLYISSATRSANLVDMDGKILHTWLFETNISQPWVHTPEIDEQGNIIVFLGSLGLAKIDWDSNIIWTINVSDNPYLSKRGKQYHHDIQIAENGDIYVLARNRRHINYSSQKMAINDGGIVILTSEGEPKDFISFYDLFGDMIPKSRLDGMLGKIRKGISLTSDDIDVFHVNTIEEIPFDIGVGKKGDLLFCVRNLNLIGIYDIEKEELIWSWAPDGLELPHHPTVLENGNILIFDNGVYRNYSRVLELNPVTKEVVWEYKADPHESFFTLTRGGNQRLPNGNTLITESGNGHVFEVTREGEIVWEFWNPDFDRRGRRKAIYRMMRYAKPSWNIQTWYN